MEKYEYYEREIHYYETDKMGIVHHSNYARFLEESRIDMLRFYNIPLDELEERGFMIPVLELHSRFLESVKFGEKIKIVVRIDKMSSAKFYISYKVYDETMTQLKHTAESVHCFLDKDFKPVGIKRMPADIYERIMKMEAEEDK